MEGCLILSSVCLTV